MVDPVPLMTRHPVGDFKRVADDGFFFGFFIHLGRPWGFNQVGFGEWPVPKTRWVQRYKVPDGFDGFDKYQVPKFRKNLGWIL